MKVREFIEKLEEIGIDQEADISIDDGDGWEDPAIKISGNMVVIY